MFYAEKMPYIQTIPCIKVFELYPHYQSCPSTTSPHVLRFLLGCEAPCLPVSPKPTCTSTVSNTKDPVTAVGQREEKATEENTAEPCVRGFSVFFASFPNIQEIFEVEKMDHHQIGQVCAFEEIGFQPAIAL